MALFIEMTGRGPSSYAPNELICGIVRLYTRDDYEPCESLYITLQGQTRVSLRPTNDGLVNHNGNTAFSSQAFLIKKSCLLANGTDLQSAGNHCWPFCFKLPSHVDPTTGYDSANPGVCFEAVSPWKGSVDAEHHLLPPSMHCFYHTGLNCAVEYVLVARLIRPPSTLLASVDNLSTTQTIIVRSQSMQADANRTDTTNTIELNSILANGDSVMKKIFHPRCSQSQQSLDQKAGRICLNIVLPAIVHLRDTAPISIEMTTTCIGVGPYQRDQLQVKRLSIQLVAHTMVRVATRQQTQSTVIPLYEGSFTLPLMADSIAPSNHAEGTDSREAALRDLDLETQIGTVMRQALHKNNIVPEFSSYNIFRAYSLQLYVRLRVCGQNFTFRRKQLSLSIPMVVSLDPCEQAPPYDAGIPPEGELGGPTNQGPVIQQQIVCLNMEPQDCRTELPPYTSLRSSTTV